MINFFLCFIMSIMISFGMSMVFVNKSDTWPVRRYRILLQLLLRKIHFKAPRALKCETCSVFWFCFISDCLIGTISFLLFGIPYFLWPLSGFAVAGLCFIIIEFLNILDKE
jgi:hypothetical protein